MTAVVEESARTRAAQLEAKLTKLNIDLIEVETQLAAMPEKQKRARIEAISKAPTQFAGKLGSEALKLQRDEETLQARRENLLREIDATNEVYAVEHKRRQMEELRPIITQAEELSHAERAAWQELGEIEARRMAVMNRLFDAVEARDGLLLEHEAQIDGCEDADLKAEATRALTPVVQPFPCDPIEVTLRVMEGSSDPGRKFRDGGERLDGLDYLVSTLPDLRGLHRHADLSGRVDKRWSSRRAAEGFTLASPR